MTTVHFSVPAPFQNFDAAAAETKIIDFIQNTVRGSGSSGVVLGLSGGIDSALVAALSVKALGTENVNPIFFYDAPPGSTIEFDSDDLRDAELLSNQLGLTLQKINLSPAFAAAKSSFEIKRPAALAEYSTTSPYWEFGETLIPSGNLKSRLRMSLLYYYANRGNLLVIGTKNKTERLTGYFTKYGDGGVDLDPIADLYKTEVRLLSKFMDLPESVLTKMPSAGFWKGQSDENDLGVRYEQLDTLLYEIEKVGIDQFSKMSSENLEKVLAESNLSKEQCDAIVSRVKSAEHKRKLPEFPVFS
ncbi:NH(3)-dependent NAD(+) synthetase [Methanimicrococcus hongohii]|uniref:NH(3)-dependent NAD(+) synthetase n=1 Tax=Methanimicrococcus hongohii TaxID=3028295 RepID=A0AA96V3L2_9EURY|nr:NAD+ synthase [Methanimicrococcus sp. Hf6]WNY24378.1 NH(3)-dependent NAD(+) synthetase [Methanimicrococcus sp. Hf6]